MPVGSETGPRPSAAGELGSIATEIQRLGEAVRLRLHVERDWTVRTLGIILIATTVLQSLPLLSFSPPVGLYRVLDAGALLVSVGMGAVLLGIPRSVREGFARLFGLRSPASPPGTGVVAEAIHQIMVNETEIHEISTLAHLTAVFLVLIVSFATVLGALLLIAWTAMLLGVVPWPWLFVGGVATVATTITLLTLAIVRWRLRSLRELDLQNTHRWAELARIQQELWLRY